jgi:tetratricopeptide (TPR) repeat protein
LLTNLVRLYVQHGRAEKAVAVCRERIDQNPKDAYAYNLLGMVQSNQKNYPAAEAALAKAIELQPTWAPPHTNLANLYLAQGKKQEAVSKFEANLDANPEDAAAYLSLALLYERDKDYANAMAVYERALKENPNFWVAANNLAFLLSEHSDRAPDFERAVTLAKSALEQRPGDPAIMDTLAWAYYRRGDYSQARDLLEKASEAAPDMAIFKYHLGMVLYQSGDRDAARVQLGKALAGDEPFIGRDIAEATLKELS